MTFQTFKIHGDNIVECERIFNFISRRLDIIDINKQFISQAAIQVDINFIYNKSSFQWRLIYHPGFNKANRKRWNNNIFDTLKAAGSFLDETPDAVITQVDFEEQKEKILCAIEFCSALQADNSGGVLSNTAWATSQITRNGSSSASIISVDVTSIDLGNPVTRSRPRHSLTTTSSLG
jgi:hypothetical protein